MHLLQVTLAAGVATPLGSPFEGIANGTFFQQIIIQNNTAASVRIGDATVSSTKGILLSSGTPGGSLTGSMEVEYSGNLNDWYAYSDTAVTLDILYIE
jgi:hypothetical protein